MFASEHGKGKRWVLLESTCGDSKETNAIAVVPANWQVEACPATIDRSYFEERADTDTSKFSFMYNNLAPYDWQQVSLAKSKGKRGKKGKVLFDKHSHWPVFRLPRDPHHPRRPRAGFRAIQVTVENYGARGRWLCLCR